MAAICTACTAVRVHHIPLCPTVKLRGCKTSFRRQTRPCCPLVRGCRRHRRQRVSCDAQNSDDPVDVPLTRPRLSYFLLAANLAVYSAGVVIALTVDFEASNDFFLLLAKVNAEVVSGEWWRLFTANFLHAGLLHLGLNCAALYAIAPEAEAVFGYGSFLAIYLLSGVAGSVASLAVDDLVTVGASGSIFGLLGALAAYFIRNPKLSRGTQQLFFIAAVASVNLLLGLDASSMVDNSGHLAGLASGLTLGLVMSPSYAIVSTVAPRAEAAPARDAAQPDDPAAGGNAALGEAQGTAGPSAQESLLSREASEPGELSPLEASIARLAQLSQTEAVEEKAPEVQREAPQAPPVEPQKLVLSVVDQTSDKTRLAAAAGFSVALALAAWACIVSHPL